MAGCFQSSDILLALRRTGPNGTERLQRGGGRCIAQICRGSLCRQLLLTLLVERAVPGDLTDMRDTCFLIASIRAIAGSCSIQPSLGVSVGVRRLGDCGPCLLAHIYVGTVERLGRGGHTLRKVIGSDDVLRRLYGCCI